MIISFSFKNHRSYQEEQEFSMERPNNFCYHQDSITSKAVANDISSVATIYGANASGKSGFIDALKFLHNVAIDSKTPWRPFMLYDPWITTNSEYSLVFVTKNQTKYQYDLVCGARGIIYEALQVWESQKPSNLFERSSNNGETPNFKFGSKFTSKNIREAIVNEANLDHYTTLLSFLKRLGERITSPAYEFFDSSIVFCNAEHYAEFYDDIQRRAKDDKELLQSINQLLPAVDLGINEIGVYKPDGEFAKKMVKQGMFKSEEDVTRAFTTILFTHNGSIGSARFESKDESRGTIAATVFIVLMQNALKTGSTLVIDELDSSLHPILVAKLVEIFNSNKTNPRGAQLIFTTHDISLIENYEDGEVLDRDQIWFTEKDQKGRSRLYPLLSIKEDVPRSGSNIGLRYIHGRYGATPNVSLFEKVLQLNREDPDNA